ncbi:MAG: amine oxidase, partial [Vulcanimicrobiaceae bacterium]
MAKSGARVVVLEQYNVLGGGARCEETWPGYTVSTASYVCSLFDPAIVQELELARYGFSAYRKQPASFTPLLDGRSLLLGASAQSDAEEIGTFSQRDVRGYATFAR